MSSYVTFNFKTKIIYGTNGAVIYDFERNKMYNIELLESKILKELERGCGIEPLLNIFSEKKVTDLCKNLCDSGIASITNTYIPRETYRTGAKIINKRVFPFKLQRCFIELPFKCDKSCINCKLPKLFGCYCCSVGSGSLDFDIDFYRHLIDGLLSYDCRKIYLYGGNPLARWNDVKSIISYTRTISNDCIIYIILPDSKISGPVAKYLKEQAVVPIINIDWPSKNVSFNADCVYNFNIEYNDYSKFKTYSQQLTMNGVNYHFCIYTESGQIQLDYVKEDFVKPMAILSSEVGNIMHPCMFGQLAIKADKKIYPCRNIDEFWGDLNNNDISTFLYEFNDYSEYWNLPFAESCSECKFRKICLDCESYDRYVSKEIKGSCLVANELL